MQETEFYIVQLKDEPLAAYAGAYTQVGTMENGRTVAPQLNLNSIQAREHESFLHSQQRAFVSDLQRRIPRAEMYRQFATVVNAVAIEVPKGTSMQDVANMPQVERVYRNEMRYEQMDSSLDLINVADSWASAGGQDNAGEGVRIAIVDGGIRPENPMFAGTNLTPATDVPTDDYCATTDASFCTTKIIAARYSNPTFTVNDNEYMSPLDYGGHGTHVAGTAAGERIDAPYRGSEIELSGVAPGAYLMVYKALFRTPTGQGSGSDVMLVEALEHAVEDGADVINNSWGGGPGFDGTGSVYDDIFTNAEAAGVVVVTAAGNDGPGEQTIGCPGCVEAGITVAASSTGRTFENNVYYGEESWSAIPGNGDFLLSEDVTATLVFAEDASEGNTLGCNAYPEDSLTGNIVLVVRGDCSFTQKANNAEAAGAVGMIVSNNTEGTISMSMPGATLVSVSLTQDDGVALRDAYVEGDEITIGAVERVIDESAVNDLAGFSSRGQNGNNTILKPEITAPGVSILSADSPDLTGDFGLKSGTSMASPHVAGAAAVLRQLRPELDAFEVKSLLMGTATNNSVRDSDGFFATPFGQGAGLLNVAGAENANFVIDAPSLVDVECQSSCSFDRTVSNLSDEEIVVYVDTQQFSNSYVTASFVVGEAEAAEELELTIPAGESATFTMTIDSRFADDGYNFGALEISQGTNASLQTFPIVFSSERADDASVLSTSVTTGEPSWGEVVTVQTNFSSPVKGEEVSLSVNLPEDFDASNIRVDEFYASGNYDVADGVLTWTGSFESVVGNSELTLAESPYGTIADLEPQSVGCAESQCDEAAIHVTGLGSYDGFTYNGTNYESITIFTNGLVAAGDQSATTQTFLNEDMPNDAAPNNLIAPFWTDLVLGEDLGGEIYFTLVTLDGTDYAVVEWSEAKLWTETVAASDPSYTVSVWLPLGEEQQDIIFNYIEVPAMPEFVTIGMEDVSGTSGLSHYYDGEGTAVTTGDALLGNLLVEDSTVTVDYDLVLDHGRDFTAATEWNTAVTVDVLNGVDVVTARSLVSASAEVDGATYNARAPLLIEPQSGLSVVLTGNVEGGEATVSNGVITFTPDVTFKGEQVITYRLRDGMQNTSSEYEVVVTVAPRDADKWYEGSLGWLFMCFVGLFGYRRLYRK
ncbi:S8 family serine peptidase [Lysobacter sp. N42]|uniref:S8 family serine peptidase n=1 Tax=Lysobacter sp. N42 TaxID=2545719 RepID=UPI0014045B45|nr:S8 family serine peptidase [Lysobacter sp. N42]